MTREVETPAAAGEGGRGVSGLKLYRIDIRQTLFVLADSAEAAVEIAHDDWTPSTFDLLHESDVARAQRFQDGKLMAEDWGPADLVYGGDGDVTLAEADEIDRATLRAEEVAAEQERRQMKIPGAANEAVTP